MAEIIRPISEEVDAPDSAGVASTISNGFLVRAANQSGTAAHAVTLVSADGDVIGSATVGANRAIIINKNSDEKLYAGNTAIKFASVTVKG